MMPSPRWSPAPWPKARSSAADADIALAVTGFAGPAGPGSEEGLVHLALARRDGGTVHREEHFGASGRGVIRVKSLKAMLEMLEQSLEQ